MRGGAPASLLEASSGEKGSNATEASVSYQSVMEHLRKLEAEKVEAAKKLEAQKLEAQKLEAQRLEAQVGYASSQKLEVAAASGATANATANATQAITEVAAISPSLRHLEDELNQMLKARFGDAATASISHGDDEAEGLETLEHNLEKLETSTRARVAEPASTKSFVAVVETLIVKKMKPKVLEMHTLGQKTLDAAEQAFSRCAGAQSSSTDGAKSARKSILAVRKGHLACRKQENRRWKLDTACARTLKTKASLVKSECKAEGLLRRSPHAEADNCHSTKTNEPYEMWVERNMRWFAQKDDQYSRQRQRCIGAKSSQVREKLRCGKVRSTFRKKREECSARQINLEGSTCSLVKKLTNACDAYGTCFASAKKHMAQQVKISKKEEKDRKAEWRALMRINCLLELFKSEDADASVIEKCKAKTHSTEHLDLKYPKVPGKLPCGNAPAAPCTTAFMKQEYGKLPKGTLPGHCKPCMLKVNTFGVEPLVWLTGEGYDPATNRWKNKGSIGDLTDVVVSGKPLMSFEAGHGAKNRILALTGGTSTKLDFGGIVPKQYTICALTRYDGKGPRRRILNGQGDDWFFGHWDGRAGVASFGGFKTSKKIMRRKDAKWVAMCSKNSGKAPNNVLVNGQAVGTQTGGLAPKAGKLYINAGTFSRTSSAFAIAELMVWDGPLTDYHMTKAMLHLMQRLHRAKLAVAAERRGKSAVRWSEFVSARGGPGKVSKGDRAEFLKREKLDMKIKRADALTKKTSNPKV